MGVARESVTWVVERKKVSDIFRRTFSGPARLFDHEPLGRRYERSRSVLTGPDGPSGIVLFTEGLDWTSVWSVIFLFPMLRFCTFLNRVLLEVEMRIEQLIAAIARSVATATVREIQAVLSFMRDTRLHHLWLQRMPSGRPAYALVPANCSMCCGKTAGSKRNWRAGRWPGHPGGVSAFCPESFEQA